MTMANNSLTEKRRWNHRETNCGGHSHNYDGRNQRLIELRFYVPLDTKRVILETFPKPIPWLGMEKLNLTQQKHAFTDQKKTKARFSCLLWHPAWNRRGPILVAAICYLITPTLTNLLKPREPHVATDLLIALQMECNNWMYWGILYTWTSIFPTN